MSNTVSQLGSMYLTSLNKSSIIYVSQALNANCKSYTSFILTWMLQCYQCNPLHMSPKIFSTLFHSISLVCSLSILSFAHCPDSVCAPSAQIECFPSRQWQFHNHHKLDSWSTKYEHQSSQSLQIDCSQNFLELQLDCYLKVFSSDRSSMSENVCLPLRLSV